nr:MAG TPA_asm: PD-(D/E)XK nuclease superfamily protein [Caudoviricetes sp.]
MTERFSASAASRLIQCPASGNLDVAIPNWTPPVVDHDKGAKGKGTAIHKIFEDAAAWTARDMRHIADAMDYVAELRSKRRFKVLTEYTVTAEWLPSKPLTTVDLVLYTQDEIHVVDYKTGKIPVQPELNSQLQFYALCVADLAPKAKGVTVHIVQPWAGIMDAWFADTTQLATFMEEAQKQEAKVTSKIVEFGPGDHCTFCPANPHTRGDKGHPLCPAMMQLLYPDSTDEEEILNL